MQRKLGELPTGIYGPRAERLDALRSGSAGAPLWGGAGQQLPGGCETVVGTNDSVANGKVSGDCRLHVNDSPLCIASNASAPPFPPPPASRAQSSRTTLQAPLVH